MYISCFRCYSWDSIVLCSLCKIFSISSLLENFCASNSEKATAQTRFRQFSLKKASLQNSRNDSKLDPRNSLFSCKAQVRSCVCSYHSRSSLVHSLYTLFMLHNTLNKKLQHSPHRIQESDFFFCCSQLE